MLEETGAESKKGELWEVRSEAGGVREQIGQGLVQDEPGSLPWEF